MFETRKPLIAAAVAMALGTAGAQAAPVLFNTQAGHDGILAIGGLDWAPTTFLAKDSNTAIGAFLATSGACPGTICQFTVMTQSNLANFQDTSGSAIATSGLGSSYQITMLAKFTERVSAFVDLGGGLSLAVFATVSSAPGIFEIYYDSNATGTAPVTTANNLTGFGFNDGRLILTGSTVGSATGSFQVTGTTPVDLDQNGTGNQYNGTGVDPDGTGPALDPDNQFTLPGFGSNGNIQVTSITADSLFFTNPINALGVNFQNISQGLPYLSPDPMDCLILTPLNTTVGTTNAAYGCDNLHVQGPYSAQPAPGAGGYVPAPGAINAFAAGGGVDVVAQTDFTSSLASDIPEPASLALMGLGLGLLGLGAARRRRSKA